MMASDILWQPDPDSVRHSNIQAFMDRVNQAFHTRISDYKDLHLWSIRNRSQFWSLLAESADIHWHQKPVQAVLEPSEALISHKWFPGGTLNYAERLFSHGGDAKKPALIYLDQSDTRVTLSFTDLKQQVLTVASFLKNQGIKKGDRIAAFMPNRPETVITYLATAAIGAIWSSCSPDFGASAAIDRFSQINPKVLLTTASYAYASKEIDLTEKNQQIADALPELAITIQTGGNQSKTTAGKIHFETILSHTPFPENFEFMAVSFNHPLCILYSSGTTGRPKCIVHSHGGVLLQHWKELALHTDIKSSDIIFYYTTCGWMMWNWLVSAFMTGATIVLYDGNPFQPDADNPENGCARLWRIAEKESVSIFGTSASYLMALKNKHFTAAGLLRLTALRTILSTGSPLTDEGFDYVYAHIKDNVQLSSISGGTDIISCFIPGCPILPVHRGQLQCRGLGMDVDFIDTQGNCTTGKTGALICRNSFPSMPVMFWNDPGKKRYYESYFSADASCWYHGDFGEIRPEGGIVIYGRCDAILNPSGVRIGTAEIYNQLHKIAAIDEALATGLMADNDEKIVLYVKLNNGKNLDKNLAAVIRKTLREEASVRHVPAKIYQVEELPKTFNGKLAELAVKSVINGWADQKLSLANPQSLQHVKSVTESEHYF